MPARLDYLNAEAEQDTQTIDTNPAILRNIGKLKRA
jgi:hypothetical protein